MALTERAPAPTQYKPVGLKLLLCRYLGSKFGLDIVSSLVPFCLPKY